MMIGKRIRRMGVLALTAVMSGSLLTAAPAVTDAAASEEYSWNSVATGAGAGLCRGLFSTRRNRI